MARPIKTGLQYYNLDTDRYQDKKIKRLKHAFSVTGIAVYDYLLCEIYRDRGCFIVWDESTAFDVAEYFGLKEATVMEIVVYCGVVGLFDKELLSGEKVLTSLSIQQRFVKICEAAKRKEIIIPEFIKLIPEETKLTTVIMPVNDGESTQSKVKESKEKEILSSAGIEEFEKKGKIESGPAVILISTYPEQLMVKAKNNGLPAIEVHDELVKFNSHHFKTAYTDATHILNSWGIWCKQYFKKKTNESKKQELPAAKPKFNSSKSADQYF